MQTESPHGYLAALKQFIYRRFELLVVIFILLTITFVHFIAINKIVFLNIYFLPTLLASYILGRRSGISVAIFSVAVVVLFVVLSPNTYFYGYQKSFLSDKMILITNLGLWAGFLILTGAMMGTLFEHNQHKASELRTTYEGVLEILAKLIDSADKHTRGHSLRVAELATALAAEMNLSEGERETVRVASLLHDIGKVDVSMEVILKAAKLSSEEIKEIHSHVEKGGQLLSPFRQLFKDVVVVILAHHRYFDGNGYGQILDAGSPLLTSVRILTIADAYDAMITDRPYRAGKPPLEALGEIEKLSGKQFDPEIVGKFRSLVCRRLDFH